MGNGEWARLFCDICGVAMRRAPCGMRFKRCRLAATDYVVIGAARLAAGGGIKQNRRVATPELLIANC